MKTKKSTLVPKHFTRRQSTMLQRVGQKIGVYRRSLSQHDKNNYMAELKRIYTVIKAQKHTPHKVLTVRELQEVSPAYIIELLADIQRKYSWSVVYSVPRSENAFLKSVIRIVHRLLDVTAFTEKLAPSQSTPKPCKKSVGTCVIFLALCRIADLPIGRCNTTLFAPSDACLRRDPFWTHYLQYAKTNIPLLRALLNHHIVPSSHRKLCDTRALRAHSDSGQTLHLLFDDNTNTILQVDGHNVVCCAKYQNSDVVVVDSLMGVLRPFGITVFQRDVMQSQLTSLCMCLSKRACTPPCGMSNLTCTYRSGGIASTKADSRYMRSLLIQTTKEYFMLNVIPMYLCYAYFPIVENVFGKINIVHMTKSFRSLFYLIALPNALGGVFTQALNFFSIKYVNKYINVLFNPSMLLPLVFAPIFEEIVCRGMLKSGFKKLLHIFPFPNTKNKSAHSSKRQRGQRRRSSTFEDLTRDDSVCKEDENAWVEWLTLITVSLIFGATHTLNHMNKDLSHPFIRKTAFIHVLLCTVGGFGLHMLAEHRGLHVSILKHFFHNFLCHFIILIPSKKYCEKNNIRLK